MTSAQPAIPVIEGFAALSERYDVIFCDVWGVLHNGIQAYPGAGDALTRFRERGGRVVLVSNAPRPGRAIGPQLDRLGVPRTAYDAIMASGDITRTAVIERSDRVVHHMGPPRDLPIFEGLDLRFGSIAEADYVVCSGFDEEDEREADMDDYRRRLAAMRERNLWMLCANPDLVVERGHLIIPCAGTIAAIYEEMGGEVFYAGKPHRPVYEAALALAARISGRGAVPRERVLAIGDAIRTDIAGAAAFGIDSLLVARGIHTAELKLDELPLASEHAQDWLARQVVRPQAVTDKLIW
ncbi:MAG TPA: TIGR01459 family HAD-type hydrolase [Microvirga sp.]|jgi:HAD superfamily hydrolase (TIGR01459 family)|nr:TIGR01459 family HAD-type hydrolase [Microvirga sp.]